ncbi:MAG: MMPL family transporter [Caulobacteraceae bacterium]
MTHEPHPGRESSKIARLALFCCDHARWIALIGLIIGLISLGFMASRFSMNTDTNALISKTLAWRVRETAFNRLFQSQGDQIVIVVDGASPELAERGAAEIAGALHGRADLFRNVSRPDDGPFFAREGLLFSPLPDVRSRMAALITAQPFLGPLAADPSLRGLMGALSTAVQGVASGTASLTDLRRPMAELSLALERIQAGKPAVFSWRNLIGGGRPDPRELRRIVLASPKLDYAKLRPSGAASDFIRHEASSLALDPGHGVRIRLTGDAPLAEEDLATLGEGAGLIAGLALAAILLMLWLAVGSARLIGAILLTMLIGLAIVGALGLLFFRRFNVISVAFIPLFVGLGIDFGIQFTVRYLASRGEAASDCEALVASARGMGRSLTLAAIAIAVGFFAFAPTDYVGVSQLGLIAGMGMFIALGLNLTVLPAFIILLKPAARGRLGPGRALEALDGFILGHRGAVLGVAAVAAAISAALLPLLHFDFNPLHLKNPRSESVATLLDLMADPNQSPNTVEIVAPDLAIADGLAARLRRLPQVAEARTISDFVPADQVDKLAAISDAASLLDLSLDPIQTAPPPSDLEVVASLRQTAADLRAAAGPKRDAGSVMALRLASDLDRLAAGPPRPRAEASEVIITPFQTLIRQTRQALAARSVTLADVPPSLRRDWLAADGRARVSVVPRGDSNDNTVLRRFIKAVRRVAPRATGPAIDVYEGGRTVEGAFVEAGILSFLAITVLLFAVLRRARHVAITMTPIVLTGLLTLASCVVLGQPLNFANIIALPLLFGIGVAFHIYFVLSWRSGGTHLLQSSLTRAVFFSALATATGFGSLWASSHPGAASMGKLLMISLIWTLVSALLFQPALMGPPPSGAEGR